MTHTFYRYSLSIALFVLLAGSLGMTAECQAEENAQFWILRGIELDESGQYQDAVQAFLQAVEIDPESEEAHLQLGNSYFEIGSYDAASNAFRRALEINPDNSTALFFLGLSLIQQKQYAESIPHFEKAGTLDSDFRQLSLFYIGEAQSELGNMKKASETWGRAIKVNPTTDIARKTGTLVKKLTQKKAKKPWSITISTGMEFDDNVTISLQDLATGEKDFANIFEFSGNYKFLKTSKFTLEADYDFYQSIYHDLSEFDLQSHLFSLSGAYQFEKFDVDVFARYNRSTLGGTDFMETYSVAPQIGFSPSKQWFALISYSFEDSKFFNDPARDGQIYGVGMDHFIFFMGGKSYFLFSYRFEDKTTRGDEFAYAGNFATIGTRTPLPFWNRKGTFNIAYRFFHKNYKNITPSLLRERYDMRHTFKVNLTQPVYKKLQLNLNYEFIDSISNLRQVDFTENIVSFALSLSL